MAPMNWKTNSYLRSYSTRHLQQEGRFPKTSPDSELSVNLKMEPPSMTMTPGQSRTHEPIRMLAWMQTRVHDTLPPRKSLCRCPAGHAPAKIKVRRHVVISFPMSMNTVMYVILLPVLERVCPMQSGQCFMVVHSRSQPPEIK